MGFVSIDGSTEQSPCCQIAKSEWSSALQIGLENPGFLFWLHPWFSAVTLSKSFELLPARFIAPVIPFDRINEEVHGPLYIHFPICKCGWMLLGCNYCSQVLRCFKSLQLFDVCKLICWYVEYLCGKKFQKSSKLSSKSGWENIVCILYKFNLVFSFFLSVKFCLSFCAQQLSVFCLKYLTSALLKSSQKLGFSIEKPLRKLFVCMSAQLWSTKQYQGWCP